MHELPLSPGWEVVHDLGHTAEVVAILPTAHGVLSASGDGSLYLRGDDGASVWPPLHLPAITTVVPVPDTTLVVVGTEGQAFGVDVPSGASVALSGFEDGASVTGGALLGGRVVVGCDDGTVRAVHLEGGTSTLATFDAPVDAVVAGGDGQQLAVRLLDGRVAWLAGEEVRWTLQRRYQEVRSIAVVDGHLVTAGMTEDPEGGGLCGVLEVVGPQGQTRARWLPEAPPAAVAGGAGHVLVVTGLGQVRKLSLDLDGDEQVVDVPIGAGLSWCSLAADGHLWFGGVDGSVRCPGRGLELRALSSGAVGVSGDVHGRRLFTADLAGVTVWDRTTLERISSVEREGACAVTTSPVLGDDLVLGRLDGLLEVVAGPTYDHARHATAVGEMPEVLGFVDEVVVVVTADGAGAFTAETLDEDDLTQEQVAMVSAFVREGNLFRGSGVFAGTVVGIVAGELVSIHDEEAGTVRVASSTLASGLVRVWDGERFLG